MKSHESRLSRGETARANTGSIPNSTAKTSSNHAVRKALRGGATEAENSKTRADAQAYLVDATLKPLAQLDPKALQVLAARNVDPRLMIAMAFQEIATNATKVGNLNISPDLLQTLLEQQ